MLLPFLRAKSKFALKRKRPQSKYRCRPMLETLEDRVVPYNLAGTSWANPNITFSYAPDGTDWNGSPSTLFADLNAIAPTQTWQREFARALQTWAEYANINFHQVPDDGSPEGTLGYTQGDSRFGDIRLGMCLTSGLAYTHFPPAAGSSYGFTSPGDITLNSGYTFAIGSDYDLYSVLLHESGHALGLDHTPGTVMDGVYSGVLTGLTSDDIAGIQAIYGPRQDDVYDAAARNDTLGSATSVSLDASGHLSLSADLTTRADVDYYKVVASGSSLTVSVDARNLSLLAPAIKVYDASGNLLGQSAVGTYGYGTVATVTLSGLSAGQTLYFEADGATADVFGVGAYELNAQFSGSSTITVPQAPSSLTATAASSSAINLNWTDNSSNESGFQIYQLVGSTWTQVATVGTGVTFWQDTGLTAATTYSYEVCAYNAAGDSADSNIASAATDAVTAAVPSAPTNLTDSVKTNGHPNVSLTWTDTSSNETGFLVQRSADGGATWGQLAQLAANSTSYTDSAVSSGAAYQYRVCAYDDAGDSGYSNVVAVTIGGGTNGNAKGGPKVKGAALLAPGPSTGSFLLSTDSTNQTLSITTSLPTSDSNSALDPTPTVSELFNTLSKNEKWEDSFASYQTAVDAIFAEGEWSLGDNDILG